LQRVPTQGRKQANVLFLRTHDEQTMNKTALVPSLSATWAVPGESSKSGAGLLFFAYGSHRTLEHFLGESVRAASSFRGSGVGKHVHIAVVTNNATVDAAVFDIHIKPRSDLLFAGEPCPYGPRGCNPNARPRQWITRLYYMALSPFEVTWALDSNVVCCDHVTVAAFLQRAYDSRLWGYDIATANQASGPGSYYPHNWNILYRWTPATSSMMRDWLLLQIRRGLAADDQATLFAAEQRQLATGGLRVGQVPTPFAAAFYSAKKPAFYPRITRPLSKAAVVLHVGSGNIGAGNEWCARFNDAAGSCRQLWMADGNQVSTLVSLKECTSRLKTARCPFAGTKQCRLREDALWLTDFPPMRTTELPW